mmetsp:Transcript_28046/g.47580  ORF Transcript_28046/g.47580 Transcript_28046/m.47580 type:complete len:296 (+) Transcript_28046:1582-2469(+)
MYSRPGGPLRVTVIPVAAMERGSLVAWPLPLLVVTLWTASLDTTPVCSSTLTTRMIRYAGDPPTRTLLRLYFRLEGPWEVFRCNSFAEHMNSASDTPPSSLTTWNKNCASGVTLKKNVSFQTGSVHRCCTAVHLTVPPTRMVTNGLGDGWNALKPSAATTINFNGILPPSSLLAARTRTGSSIAGPFDGSPHSEANSSSPATSKARVPAGPRGPSKLLVTSLFPSTTRDWERRCTKSFAVSQTSPRFSLVVSSQTVKYSVSAAPIAKWNVSPQCGVTVPWWVRVVRMLHPTRTDR